MTSPNIPTWKKAAYAATTCILFFLMLEVVLWLCGVNTILDRHDPWRGFSGMINVFERDGDVYRTRRFEDHWTFNSQSFSAEKQDDAIRIFCLGGSSAYGYPWGADAAFTAILGEALSAAHPQRTVEAVNASGVSYGIHRLRLLTPEILSYEPDILIIYSGHNEFIEPTFFQSLKEQSAPRRRFEFVLAHSRFYSAIRQWSSHRSEDSTDESAGSYLSLLCHHC